MLVGRDPELRQVDALVSAARIGQSGVLVVTGEAGIGKTSVLGYAVARAEGMHVLRATGTVAERDLPFAALGQLLRLSVEDLDRLPQPQAQALGVALALRPGSGVDRFAVGAGTVTCLTQRAVDHPVLLVLDDAHLMDVPSQEALAFLARRLLADAVAMVVAARADEDCLLAAPDLPTLRLSGLDAAATGLLVGTELAARVCALTGGNPLAIQQLAADPARLLTLPPHAPAPVPAALAEHYARRAAALGPDALRAVQVAAVAGEDLAVVTAACAHLGVPAGLGPAEAAGLVELGPGRVRFPHPLVRSGLYAAATPERRRELHQAVASVLPDAEADRRAWHRSEAAVGPDEATAAELAWVAGRAADRGAFAVAATAAERAAWLSPSAPARGRRLLDAGTWAWQAGQAERARDLLDRALPLDPAPGASTRNRRLRGVVAARCGSVEEARDVLLAAGAAAPDASEAIACYAEAVNACLYLGDAAASLVAAERVEALLEDADGEARRLGLIAAGMARVLAGLDGADLIRAGLDQVDVPRTPEDRGLDASAWQLLGALFLRDSRSGRDLVRRAVDQRRAESAVGTLPHLLFHIARDAAASDGWPRAEADYSEAITIARESGQTTELAVSLAGLAWLQARQGRTVDATRHAVEAEALCARAGIHLGQAWARFALADLAAGAGQVATAVQRYTALEESLVGLGVRDVDLAPLPELVELHVHRGERDRARALAEEYRARAEQKGQPWAMARAARARGLVCPPAEVDPAFWAASALHAETLDAYETARTRLAYGARLRRLRRRVDARPPLQEALDAFGRLGATPWAEAAADELAATGATVARPGQSALSSLTPRELQVALALAEGCTTREAASALFLSPKTVEYHLRHVYPKLGIASRAELSRALGGGPGIER